MKVDLSLGMGHRDQADMMPDFIQVYTTDAADLNVNLAKVAIPLLKCLKGFRQGVPREFNPLIEEQLGDQLLFDFVGTDEESERVLEVGMGKWHAAIDEMIWAFQQHANGNVEMEHHARTRNGLRLFAEYYHTLWN